MRIRKDARQRYVFDESLFSRSGHLVLENVRAAHVFANVFNTDRPDSEKISPAELNAANIVYEIQHRAISNFVSLHDPELFGRVLDDARSQLGTEEVELTLEAFTERFPTDEIPDRELTLEEMLLCWVTNDNPAYGQFSELIHDDDIRAVTPYEQVIDRFKTSGSSDSGDSDDSSEQGRTAAAESNTTAAAAAVNLLDLLLEPAKRAPNSLKDQLAFMAGGDWGLMLPQDLVERAAIGGDLIVEENQAMAARSFVPGPPPPPPVPDYLDEPEFEQFSQDIDWMPRVVMVAKNAFVWLDQLSKKYDRPITRLDEIPDEELGQLARWGFTALWLIGVWQRSAASRTLKRRTGNPEAEASAYSLYDYVIADELGGEEALDTFRAACREHGLRLSADMVPNHTGIESKWVSEHPDWFIQLPYSPYPSYSFSSESLVDNSDIQIQVEDGYYDRSDAAVAFRRLDPSTGDERFIYHGNDGTGMAWNDTAQLDFTKPEVREAVIQTILHVARQFPIIRFDAAMVLTRKHFRRLWYPTPGSGGGVPSRAEHGLSREEFDDRMPVEFWREVVDRVAEEVPDTLLLAEAFWLLEGYFVRTLGMHRVYNSAFMHMLKDEDNAKYREVMKNTLAFEPEVLKRYVNFMSNPDEETAIDQFGDGDRFFGVSAMLVTMPGLPMIAHGQVEGLTEKYGMEYRRAYRDESVREDLVARFERQIAPLIRKRYLFADVANFYLFDYESEGGATNENVFVYSNGHADERALVVYNNRFENTSGRVRMSTHLEDGPKTVSLDQALNLDRTDGDIVTFKDMTSRLEYVVPADDFFDCGLHLALDGYQHHVFTGFEVIEDDEDGTLGSLALRLGGRGVTSLDVARTEIRLEPLERFLSETVGNLLDPIDKTALQVDQAANLLGIKASDLQAAVDELAESIELIQGLSTCKDAVAELETCIEGSNVFSVLVAIECLRTLTRVEVTATSDEIGLVAGRIMLNTGLTTHNTAEAIGSIARSLFALENPDDEPILSLLLDGSHFSSAFLINEFEGTTYYNRERFELGLASAFCLDALRANEAGAIADRYDEMQTLRGRHEAGTYRWKNLTGPPPKGNLTLDT